MNYKEKLRHPKWQKKRLEILERDQWACGLCYDEHTTLHVHHIRYSKTGNPWDSLPKDLITLCERCHEIISDIKPTPEEFKKIKVVSYWNDNKCAGAFYSIMGTFYLRSNNGSHFGSSSVGLFKELRSLINHSIRSHV